MNGTPDRIDSITQQFQRETAALRRRTLILTLVPIAVGALVVVTAYLGVSDARAKVAAADEQLEAKRAELAELERQIEEKQALFDYFSEYLPSETRQRARDAQKGLEALRGGRFEEAAELLGEVVREYPRFAEGRFNLGLALAGTGDEQAAEAEVEAAIRIDPRYKERLESLPTTRKIQPRLDPRQPPVGRTPDPDRTPIGRTPDVDPGRDAAQLVEEGRVAIDRGELAVASERFDRALALNPDNFEVLALKGQAQLRAGELGAAEESLRQALELDEGFAAGHFDLALVLWRSGDRPGAVAELERALELDPGLRQRVRDDPEYRRIRRWQQQGGPG